MFFMCCESVGECFGDLESAATRGDNVWEPILETGIESFEDNALMEGFDVGLCVVCVMCE